MTIHREITSDDPVDLSEAPEGEQLGAVLTEYLTALEQGLAPDREEFLRRYPDVTSELRSCLEGLEFIHQMGARVVTQSASASPLEPLRAPSIGLLGDFRIVREIGRGGMGIVYAAEKVSLGRQVALKVLPFAAMLDPTRLKRFHFEAHAAATLDHPAYRSRLLCGTGTRRAFLCHAVGAGAESG